MKNIPQTCLRFSVKSCKDRQKEGRTDRQMDTHAQTDLTVLQQQTLVSSRLARQTSCAASDTCLSDGCHGSKRWRLLPWRLHGF